ncbi:MAG: hypothetical protein ACTSUE_08965 [Promethearchaeota archaeon]
MSGTTKREILPDGGTLTITTDNGNRAQYYNRDPNTGTHVVVAYNPDSQHPIVHAGIKQENANPIHLYQNAGHSSGYYTEQYDPTIKLWDEIQDLNASDIIGSRSISEIINDVKGYVHRNMNAGLPSGARLYGVGIHKYAVSDPNDFPSEYFIGVNAFPNGETRVAFFNPSSSAPDLMLHFDRTELTMLPELSSRNKHTLKTTRTEVDRKEYVFRSTETREEETVSYELGYDFVLAVTPDYYKRMTLLNLNQTPESLSMLRKVIHL